MAALSPLRFSARSHSARDENTAMDSRVFKQEENESSVRWADNEPRHAGRDDRDWRRLDTVSYSHRAPAPPHGLRYGNAFPYRVLEEETTHEERGGNLYTHDRRYEQAREDRGQLTSPSFLLGETRGRALPREDVIERNDEYSGEKAILRQDLQRGYQRHYDRDIGRLDFPHHREERLDARLDQSARSQARVHHELRSEREAPSRFHGSYFARDSEFDSQGRGPLGRYVHEQHAAPTMIRRLPSLAERSDSASRMNGPTPPVRSLPDRLMSMAALHRTSSESAIPVSRYAAGDDYSGHLQRRITDDGPSIHRLTRDHALPRTSTWSPTSAGSPEIRTRKASDDSISESKATEECTEAPQRKKKKRKVRICTTPGCSKLVVDHGVCIRHGGGKRCNVEGCECRAQNKGLCWKHGGYTICQVDGCAKRAKSRGMCWSHGGGTQCKTDGCEKIAVSRGRCWAHGGGKRCKIAECQKPAALRLDDFCTEHYAAYQASVRGRSDARQSVASERYA